MSRLCNLWQHMPATAGAGMTVEEGLHTKERGGGGGANYRGLQHNCIRGDVLRVGVQM